MIREMRVDLEWIDAGFDRLEAKIDILERNQRCMIGLSVAILIAIIASNWLG